MVDIEKILATPPAGPRPEVTPEHADAIKAFKAHFGGAFRLEGKELGDRELMWLSQETMLRFLRATHGDIHATISRLEATLAWRRSLNLYDIDATAAIAERETQHGTRFVAGWNTGARPVNYIFLNNNVLPLDQREMVQNMFLFERMMDLTPAGAQEICTVFNFGGSPKGPSPALGSTREMLANYDRHYPLQPSLTLLQDMGWKMRTFVNMVWPFIGAEQREKTFTKAGEQAVKDGQFKADALIKKCGGALDFEYDHATYWPTIIRMAKERREAYLDNWLKLGDPEAGRSEFDWKFV